jgi:hypothetical protein
MAKSGEIVYVVHEPGWEGGFDSVWSTEEEARARADELDPWPDKDGVRWGIITREKLNDPNAGEGLTR